VPTFFLQESQVAEALPRLLKATRPDGWIVLGRMDAAPDPLAQATSLLELLRGGGVDLDAKRAMELLEDAGFIDVHVAPRTGPVPLELVVGRKPAR
jgi:hypothetical protein